MSYEPTKLDGFQQTIVKAPKDARVFTNGDICVAREHEKGRPRFAYYGKSSAGYVFERTFWKGRATSGYNHCKNQPGFVAPTTKPAVSKPATKIPLPVVITTPPVKSKPKSRLTKADLQNQLDDMSVRFEAAVKMLNDLGYGVK